jgi:hypothetical protein
LLVLFGCCNLVGAAVGHGVAILDSDPTGAHKKELKLIPPSGHASITTAEWSGGLQEPGFVNYFAEDQQRNQMMRHPSSSDGCPCHYYIEDQGKRDHGEASFSCDEIAGGGEPDENQIKKQKTNGLN